MENANYSLYRLDLFERPWLLDAQRGMLIDFLSPDNMLHGTVTDDPAGGFTFLVQNPNGSDQKDMLLRVVNHTERSTEGRKAQSWIELQTIVGDSESVRTLNHPSSKRRQVFVLFKEAPFSKTKKAVTAKSASMPDDKTAYPFLGMATFEHPNLHVRDAIFHIDFKNFELIDVEDKNNIIRISDMRDNGSGYEFYYDPKIKNKRGVPHRFIEKDTGPYLVRFNYLAALHPYAMAVYHHVPVGVIDARTDKEFMDKLNQWKKQNRAHQQNTIVKRQTKRKGRKLH